MSLIQFSIICIMTIIWDIGLIYRTLREKKKLYGLLTRLYAVTIGLTLAYLFSTLSKNYFANSFFSSVYFAGVTIVLLYMSIYVRKLCLYNMAASRREKFVISFFAVWVHLDALLLLLNAVIPALFNGKEFVMHYEYMPQYAAHWEYHPMPLYSAHLFLSYCLVLLILATLVYRSLTSPRVYRSRYRVLVAGIVVVVLLNAVFLYVPDMHIFDVSLFLYTIMSTIILWYNNSYAERGMLNEARTMVINELSNPMVLFDFENALVMNNRAANFLLEGVDRKNPYLLETFAERWKLDAFISDYDRNSSFQYSTQVGGKEQFFRCDYSVLLDEHGTIIGRLFLFADYSLEYDLLTGFATEHVFRQNIAGAVDQKLYPVGVATFDINHLAQINQIYGREKGDLAIRLLAQTIKANTPEGSSYVRLSDANLLFISYRTDLNSMRGFVQKIHEQMKQAEGFGNPIEIQSAIGIASANNPDLLIAVAAAVKSMKAKKLMDVSSAHSSLLDSLAQTLQESDSCTREHVKRTQIMGEKLGLRLGLSDLELSNLKLLCLLHDIGKLGIPLEILNKPGKLTEEEWVMMKSHADKGYRIAKASVELEDIAELILHHHECWNGKGYPDGLEREAIPLLSRIIAVVDTYDAMTNDRPYRQALSRGQACKELMRCAGTQFDPFIVSEFIELLRENELFEETDEKENGEKQPEETVKPMGLEENDDAEASDRELFAVKYTQYILNGNNEILSVDELFEQMTGYSEQDVKEYHLTQMDLIFTEDLTEYRKMVKRQLAARHEAFLEHRIRRKDGGSRYVFCHGREYFDSVTREPRVRITATDISSSTAVRTIIDRERESARRSLKRWEDSVRRDPLTGLLNRIAYQNDVQLKLMDEQSVIAMIMLDLDYFKQYNDTRGHKKGDELLIIFAGEVRKSTEPYGFCSRMGGDEFSAILCFEKNTPKQKIEQVIHDIWKRLTTNVREQDEKLSVSMGAAFAEGSSMTFNALYKEADTALYEAKNTGRGKCVIR